MSVTRISGICPPSCRYSRSMKCGESLGVPDTTIPASPADWSLTRFSQVDPLPRAKYFGFGRAWMVRTGTTNRIPSTAATSPPPQACASSISAWASTSGVLAAA